MIVKLLHCTLFSESLRFLLEYLVTIIKIKFIPLLITFFVMCIVSVCNHFVCMHE